MAGAARQRGETLWQSTQLPSLVEQQQGQTPPRVSRGSCAYAERACYSCRMGAALGAPLGESPGHWVRPEPGLPSVRALEPQGRLAESSTLPLTTCNMHSQEECSFCGSLLRVCTLHACRDHAAALATGVG